MSRQSRHRLIQHLAGKRERHRRRSRVYRVLFTAAGFTVTLAGVIMLALPGPALAVIPVGLAMLALEFTWAEQLLERALDQADKARRKAQQASLAQRWLTVAAGLCALGAAVAAAVVWDLPVVPV